MQSENSNGKKKNTQKESLNGIKLPDLSGYEIPEDYDLFNDENLDMLP